MGAEIPVLAEGWPHTGRREPTCQVTPRIDWISRRDRFEQMWRDDVDAEEMADFFETSRATIYAKASQWKLGRRRNRMGGRKPKANRTSQQRGGTQRRFMSARHDEAGPRVQLAPHDPRLRAGITIFPTTVKPASEVSHLLISGVNSRKIGRVVEKGRWKGFHIYTLTLEERATCPRTCKEWATCYGNNMHLPNRILDDGTLTRRLWGELASLNARHPAGFVVRLHVLGDFYSRDYVRFWAEALSDFPALRVFGFTARRPNEPIGADLVHLVAEKGDRFVIRFSGGGYETHCAEVVDRPEDATGVLCPAQRDPKRCCATCALCFQSDVTISFLRH